MTLKQGKDQTNSLVLGIDTGGTYTDGVLLEYHSRRVLSAHKSLTTKHDFSIGIERVMQAIQIENPSAIRMVAISTTLATNAIAEGKGKRAALFLIGYDPDLLASFQMEKRLATPHYYFFAGGHDLYGQEKEALDLDGIQRTASEVKSEVEAIAISAYFSPLNPDHENRARAAVAEVCNLPVVLGHQLSTKLGSIERATTAVINASLLGILQNFIVAVHKAMEQRGITAPLMIVRGDGTLMSAEEAMRSPIETIHSGPAASAIGGRFLSGLENALVLDVGGTTTDLALLQDGQVTVSEQGATVANYKTAVRAANLFSIGMGGDSRIHIEREKEIRLGPQRVTPLSYLAEQYPEIQARLKALAAQPRHHLTPRHAEYWFLQRHPDDRLLKSPRQRQIVAILRKGPCAITDLLQQLNLLHENQANVDDLLQQEIIGCAGLTPTDLLHVDGRYAPWNREAAQYALQIFCRSLNLKPDKFMAVIWKIATETIVQAILSFLTQQCIPNNEAEKDSFGRWVLENSLHPSHAHLEISIRLKAPIIGIGAPAEVFLREAAALFHTELILPDNYHVANAIGAVAGSVMSEETCLVYPRLSSQGLEAIGYFAQNGTGRYAFESLGEALNRARALAQERAVQAVLRAGASNPQVRIEEVREGLDTYRIHVKAFGNPRLG